MNVVQEVITNKPNTMGCNSLVNQGIGGLPWVAADHDMLIVHKNSSYDQLLLQPFFNHLPSLNSQNLSAYGLCQILTGENK